MGFQLRDSELSAEFIRAPEQREPEQREPEQREPEQIYQKNRFRRGKSALQGLSPSNGGHNKVAESLNAEDLLASSV
jgi:hypothetical protein